MSPADRIIIHPDPDLEDIIPGYLENRRKELNELRTAVTGSDFETLRVLGHRMKGSGAGYGFKEITDIGRCIEERAKATDGSAIEAEIDRLEDYLQRVDVVYKE
ncbi:MAG: Hpt domain-containing protein [Magnetococcales bacterium]|nr:Hpt domain-containing protein [Magnetococcales bacterium]